MTGKSVADLSLTSPDPGSGTREVGDDDQVRVVRRDLPGEPILGEVLLGYLSSALAPCYATGGCRGVDSGRSGAFA